MRHAIALVLKAAAMHKMASDECRDAVRGAVRLHTSALESLRAENARLREALEQWDTMGRFEGMLDSASPPGNPAVRAPAPTSTGVQNDA